MKFKLGLILLVICSSRITMGQIPSCSELRKGVFQFRGHLGDVYTIVRADSNQSENSKKTEKYTYTKIKWIDNCNYTLSERREYYKGKKLTIDSTKDISYNTVWKFEKPNKYYIKTYYLNQPDTIETIMTKIDSSKFYDNLFQLKAFSEFKKSKSFGRTFIEPNYFISYYESNNISNRYLITFETIYEGEKLNLDMKRLIDTTIVCLAEKQSFILKNCRYKGEYDNEIVAVYLLPTNDEPLANIIKAFRCNRQTEKIEPLDIKFVEYRLRSEVMPPTSSEE
jgi:hypothetical protein